MNRRRLAIYVLGAAIGFVVGYGAALSIHLEQWQWLVFSVAVGVAITAALHRWTSEEDRA